MKYSRVFIESIGYELAPVVVTSRELEERLEPVYRALRWNPGQLEALTGIIERRWWEKGYGIAQGATAAAKKAIASTNVDPTEVELVTYAGVCREQFEPATACHVASGLGVSPGAAVYDISNACLGMLNGIIDVANRIELGQIRAGLVCASESAREINEVMIEKMLENKSLDFFTKSLATLTGGSGAAAVLLTDGSFGSGRRRRLIGGITQADPARHALCRWGMVPSALGHLTPFMSTDSVAVLKYGVDLGRKTWEGFLGRMKWSREQVDKVICHQVGSSHRLSILKALGIPIEKDFATFAYLGNMGTVSVPLTAALAEQRQFIKPGDRVGFLGIGSGLNCLMLGWEW